MSFRFYSLLRRGQELILSGRRRAYEKFLPARLRGDAARRKLVARAATIVSLALLLVFAGNFVDEGRAIPATGISPPDGPPGYARGYTGTDVKSEVELPDPDPKLNQVFTDGSFDTPIVRVTDGATYPLSGQDGIMLAGTDSVIASIHDDAFIVGGRFGNNNVCQIVRAFDFTKKAASHHAGSGNGQCIPAGASRQGWEITGRGRFTNSVFATFSYASGDVIYGWAWENGSELRKALRSTQAFRTVYEMDSAGGVPGALSRGYNVLTFSKDMTRFVWVGNVEGDRTAGQNQWTMVAVCYNPDVTAKRGCRYYNVATGAVANGPGSSWEREGAPAGEISTASRYKVHRAILSQDGKFVVIVQQNCFASCQDLNGTVWEIETTTAREMLKAPHPMRLGGHNQVCWSGMLNWPNNSDRTESYFRPLNNLADKDLRIPPITPRAWSYQSYGSCSNAVADDSQYHLYTLYRTDGRGSVLPYDNEFLLVKTTGEPRAVRVNKTGDAARSSAFSYPQPRGLLWPSGRAIEWCTNWSLHGGNLRGRKAYDCFLSFPE
jgi:hypothetical protein